MRISLKHKEYSLPDGRKVFLERMNFAKRMQASWKDLLKL